MKFFSTHFLINLFHYTGSEGITYIIPRSNGQVVLGGTANKHDL